MNAGASTHGTGALAAVASRLSLDDFRAAAARIRGDIIHIPLLPQSERGRDIRLKPECLQPLGSFKIRAAANALALMDTDMLKAGVVTASAGNFAQGLALAARRRGVALTVHAPDTIARIKADAIRALGARIVAHPFPEWWRILSTRSTGAADGIFVHPVCEPSVILGNGTIGLELAEEWPHFDTVVVPFGGGGLAVGIALALRALSRRVRILACEVETVTPLAAAFAAGKPTHVERHASFVDGIGSNCVLEEMWPLLRELIDDVIVVSIEQAKAAVRDLALRHHIVAEGAGAAAFAAAQSQACVGDRVVAVVSGGNIDPEILCPILTSL